MICIIVFVSFIIDINIKNIHLILGKRLSRFSIPRDIVSLNNSLLIECPDYSGPLLPKDLNLSCNNVS